ncbi:MAG: hypothetical protein EZS28_017864 [Streblomastix strix]|uniref:Reverse transcriptase domain-containing protein n=1 Tax=Streblomastix strix TaxID=222440 RepID=A0A5J4VVP4_9EUKA|nr:MAG: hypothetical protein EZS28_017864 [Streblomastix strix]
MTFQIQVRKKKKTMKDSFDQELNQEDNELVPNRLINRIGKWEEIGGAHRVLKGAQPNWISNHLIKQLYNTNKSPIFRSTPYQEQEYNNQLFQELHQGVVIETNQIKIYNPSFIVMRPDGRYRKILDCRLINQLTKSVHFKIKGVLELSKLMEKGDYATTLDIKDAFLNIRVSPTLQPYFGFMFRIRSYTYAALPFGYKRSPYIFSKILSKAIQTIRKTWPMKIQAYMDDIVILCKNKESLKTYTLQINQFLKDLGWRISYQKCRTYLRHANAPLEEKIDEEQTRRLNIEMQKEGDSEGKGLSCNNRRDQLSEIPHIVYECSTINEEQSCRQRRLVLQSEDQSNIEGQSGDNPHDDQDKPTKMLIGTDTQHSDDNRRLRDSLGCNTRDTRIEIDGWRRMDERLASQLEQLTRSSSCTDGPEILSPLSDISTDIMPITSNGQYSNRVQSPKMESINQSDSYCEEDSRAIEPNADPNYYTPYSRNQQFSGRCIKQNGLAGRLYDEERENVINLPTTELLPEPRHLRDSNFQVMKKVLLSIRGQKSRSKRCIPRAIAKPKRDGVVALFILPDWALTKYYQMFPTILAALNLGPASQVLHEGKKMNRLQLKLPPGDLLAVLINTLEENQFTENQNDRLVSMNNQSTI